MARKVEAMLVDVRSAHNVGAMLRTADCAGVIKLYLAGYTPSPLDEFGRARAEISKTSLGANESVAWEVCVDAIATIKQMQGDGAQVVALEQTPKSIDYRRVLISGRVLFIVGNEVDGLSQEILDAADFVASIPCRGIKESLNVSSAFAIAAYAFTDD